MSQAVLWQRLDRPTLEFAQWTVDREVILRRDVVGDMNGVPGRVMYRVRVGDDQLTRVVRVHLWSDSGNRHLYLCRSHQGQWQANGIARPDLADATDVDIGVTPATNTLPIRRFRVAVGESCELVAARVQFPALSVIPARQRYTRIGADRYLYESLESRCWAELTVRDDGIVVQYGDIWRTLTDTSSNGW